MTNPTTPQPVQEPAGAVEAKIDEIRDIVSSLGDYRIMEDRGHATAAQVKEAQDEFETALSALASLQPVTQAQSLLDAATGKTPHVFNGLCPDAIEGPDVRDPDCPACQALLGVTQAKSEAVAWQVKQKAYKDRGPWVDVDRVTYESASKYPERCEVRALVPQEAVERQPLTEEQVHIGYREVRDAGLVVNFLQGIRYAERHHGIGPATQEEQHG